MSRFDADGGMIDWRNGRGRRGEARGVIPLLIGSQVQMHVQMQLQLESANRNYKLHVVNITMQVVRRRNKTC